MKKIFFTLTLMLCLHKALATTGYDREKSFEEITNAWFSAWELVYKDIYNIHHIGSVDFVFFDDKYIYSTSDVSISGGTPIKGPNLMNLQLAWKKEYHNGTISLPDSTTVPLGTMSFAATNEKGNKPFFVMPLTSFWSTAGVQSKELGLNNLVTGIFLHEFSHTQQMQNFGKKITYYEQQNKYTEDFDDDIIQRIFQKDSSFTELYNREVAHFYAAINNVPSNLDDLKKGLQIMKTRKQQFFKEEYASLNAIEDLFLTMEGLGQYSMYRWLIHQSGAGMDKEIAIEGVRRNKKWWSQDEGFVLFLLLEQFKHPKLWAKEMFGDRIVTVIELLQKESN